MYRFFFTIVLVFGLSFSSFCQSTEKVNLDSLIKQVIVLDQELYQVQLNLNQSQKQLKTGIFIATVGYSVTILGGQLLGSNPDLGKTLLYTGGAIGIGGTYTLVRGFNKISLGPPRKRVHY
ncbi:hypothetical protein SAMN06295967_105149 [Belliella buryatensis]|uniref:Uncharacterized protein n=1 Tax=Belliella buryatensis TaxID=1500549 RepID=A0A239CPE8_9BACT|nr:hypothetical protein [Belliella buryatensis]SNS21742.1 hypothetical protein SAMN06295967_105149 [Belliella buryatensis]